ncbi:hypothetical protein DPSP01_011907 [Paraphaeosphaeria sporulosa]
MRKVFSTHVWANQTYFQVECGGYLEGSPENVFSHLCLEVHWMEGLDRRAGCAVSVQACSDVTNQMQLHTFARLFQGQNRPIWSQTESMYSSNFEAAQSSACCWGKSLGS